MSDWPSRMQVAFHSLQIMDSFRSEAKLTPDKYLVLVRPEFPQMLKQGAVPVVKKVRGQNTNKAADAKEWEHAKHLLK